VFKVRGKTPERIYREIEATLPPSESESGGSSPPQEPLQPGDIIYDEASGRYGEIVTIDKKTGRAKIAEITKEEAKSRV
jgi:hypothetical protein